MSSSAPDLLSNNMGEDRFLVGSPTYPDVMDMYYTMRDAIWFEKDIVLQEDIAQFNALSAAEKHMLLVPLFFFRKADGAVNENIGINFTSELEYPEIRLVYGVQTMMEGVHQIVYDLILRTYVKDIDERNRGLHAAETMPCVAQKMAWAEQYANTKESFAQRMFGYGIMEGFFFQTSFGIIYWFKSRGLLPGLTKSNELIARDEGLHCEFAAMLYSKLAPHQRISQETAHEMMDAAMLIEEAFVRAAIPEPLSGINAELMMQFMRFWANKLLRMFGYAPHYDAKGGNPLEWFNMINLNNKTNFFERREANYSQHTTKRRKLLGDTAADDDDSGSDC